MLINTYMLIELSYAYFCRFGSKNPVEWCSINKRSSQDAEYSWNSVKNNKWIRSRKSYWNYKTSNDQITRKSDSKKPNIKWSRSVIISKFFTLASLPKHLRTFYKCLDFSSCTRQLICASINLNSWFQRFLVYRNHEQITTYITRTAKLLRLIPIEWK